MGFRHNFGGRTCTSFLWALVSKVKIAWVLSLLIFPRLLPTMQRRWLGDSACPNTNLFQPRPQFKSFRKRVLLCWVALLVMLAVGGTSSVYGETVTAKKARQVVKGWLSETTSPLNYDLSNDVADVDTYKTEKGDPAYYIVNLDPSGFVVVPAEDLVQPIIAFADSGEFDPSSSSPFVHLVSRDCPQRVAQARAAAAQDQQRLMSAGAATQKFAENQDKWDNLVSKSAENDQTLYATAPSGSDAYVEPLVESKWGQSTEEWDACYNYYTPRMVDGTVKWDAGNSGNYVAGCVATAMAQLMRFHKYPEEGVGTPSFNVSVDETSGVSRSLLGGDGSGGAYDWSNMVLNPPDWSNAESETKARKAIGRLCHDAGVAVNMGYSSSGSGAYLWRTDEQMDTTFDYSTSVLGTTGEGSNLSSQAIKNMLNANLDAGYPVILAIKGSGAHAIVADGYGKESDTWYHHLNMGWTGSQDAWYNLPDILGFDTVYQAIYNVFPEGNGEIISGRVVDLDGNPIQGVTVSTSSSEFQATTNDKGIYALTHVSADTDYTLTASKTGWEFNGPKTVSTGKSQDGEDTSGNRWGVNFTEPHYTLTYAAGEHGSIDGDTTQAVALGGDGSQVEAIADPGYHFLQWSDGSTENPRTDTNVTADLEVTAEFWPDESLVYTAAEGGYIEGDSTQAVPPGGDGTEVQAVAEDGYHFLQWSDGSTENPRQDLELEQPVDVEAEFGIALPYEQDFEDLALGTPASDLAGWDLRQDNVLQFDGSNDYVETTYPGVGGASPRTVAFWFKSDAEKASRLISWGVAESGRKYHIRVDGNLQTLRVENEGGNHYGGKGEQKLTDGEWHHCAVVFPDGASDVRDHILYVDGQAYTDYQGSNQQMDTSTQSTVRMANPSSEQGQGDEYAQGAISEVRIYDRALTSEEVDDLLHGRNIADNLVGYWPMNEGQDRTVYDRSDNSNDGTISGADWALSQKDVLQFDGSNDYVETTYPGVGGASPRTVAFWFKSDAEQGSRLISWGVNEAGRKYHIRVQGDSLQTLRVENAGGNHYGGKGEQKLTDGEWHHCAVVFPDGASDVRDHILYVDGQAYTDYQGSNQQMDTSTQTTVRMANSSSEQGNSDYYAEGVLSEVRIYDRALTSGEVDDLLHGQHIADNLVGHWPLNEGRGKTVYDWSDNSNDGTIYGAEWTLCKKDADIPSLDSSKVVERIEDYNHEAGYPLPESSHAQVFDMNNSSIGVNFGLTDGEYQRLYLDIMVRFTSTGGRHYEFFTGLEDLYFGLRLNENSQLEALHGGAEGDNAASTTFGSFSPDTWYRLTAVINIEESGEDQVPFFRILIDGTELSGETEGFAEPSLDPAEYTGGPWFNFAPDTGLNYRAPLWLRLGSNIMIDDVVVAGQTYTVVFQPGDHGSRDGGGELFQAVQYGDSATAPEITSDEGWEFIGWDADFANVTSDMTVTAQYEQREYSVTFDLGEFGSRNGGGELEQTVLHGDSAEEPDVATVDGWEFIGWDTGITNVTEDLAVNARYSPIDNDADSLPDAWEQQIVDAADDIDSIEDVNPEDDFNGSGRSNRLEYALGLNPTAAKETPLTVDIVKDENGNSQLEATFNVRSPGLDVGYVLQTCSDLKTGDWSGGSLVFENDAWQSSDASFAVVSQSYMSDGLWEITVRLQNSDTSNIEFFRVGLE